MNKNEIKINKKIEKENKKDYKKQMKIYNKIKKIFFKNIKYYDFIDYDFDELKENLNKDYIKCNKNKYIMK